MTPLPKPLGDKGAFARLVNTLIKCLDERTLQSSRSIRIRHRGNSMQAEVVRQFQPGEAGASTQRYRVKTVAGDTLTCRTWDGSEEGESDVTVAKPQPLRRSDWHNVTRDGATYTATNADGSARTLAHAGLEEDATSEEVLVPSYAVNDVIVADQPDGGTGVANVTWEDTNRGARSFHAPYKLRRVCISGVWKFVVRREGEPFGNPT